MRRRFKTTGDRTRLVMAPLGKRFFEAHRGSAIEYALSTARKHNPGFRVTSCEITEWKSGGDDDVVIVNVRMVRI